jgi:hypothetical protein
MKRQATVRSQPRSKAWLEDVLEVMYPQVEVTNFEVLELGEPSGASVEWLAEVQIARQWVFPNLRVRYDAARGLLSLRHSVAGDCSLLQSSLGQRLGLALLLEYRQHLDALRSDRLHFLRTGDTK